ncbi:MAG: hypothetical protein KIT17_03740 [Rubrivivax sp.]|nr:hypothetical protein [Rubrivivax sp.]
MSYVERRFPAPHMRLPFFFNVDEAVGPGAPNRPGDVLLVQVLLGAVLNHPSYAYRDTIPRDGHFNSVTARAITEFQRSWRRMVHRARHLRDGAIDGRVSRAENIGYDRGSEVWTYTIVALNIECKTYQPDLFQALADANSP